MKRYVAGFLFDNQGEKVALIEKQRPDWQRWQLNGIGGKIERNQRNCMCYENDCDQMNFDPCICPWEEPNEAMRREFREETGVDLETWKEYCLLYGRDWEVHFFMDYNDSVFNVETKTDERVAIYEVLNVLDARITHPLIPNLRWLIPMALSMIYEPQIIKYAVQMEEQWY